MDGGIDEDLRRRYEASFHRHGVPHFVEGYSTINRPELDYVLFTIIAFEMAVIPAQSSLDPNSFDMSNLLVSIPILVIATISIRPFLSWLPDLSNGRRPGLPQLLRATAVLVPVLLLLHRGGFTPFWQRPWLYFTELLLIFSSVRMLFRRPLETLSERPVPGVRRWIAAISVAFTVLAATDSTFLHASSHLTDWINVSDEVLQTVTALPGLIASLAVFLLALRISREVPETDVEILQDQPLHPLPLVVLFMGIEQVVWQNTEANEFIGFALPLCVLLLLVHGGIFRRRTSWVSRFGVQLSREAKHLPVRVDLLLWLALYFLAPPIIAAGYVVTYVGPGVLGNHIVLLVLSVHIFYAAVAMFIVGFRLGIVASWTLRAIPGNLKSLAAGLTRGVPLLLVFATFFLLTGEIWEVAYNIRERQFVVILTILLVFAAGSMALASKNQLNNIRRRKSPSTAEWREANREKKLNSATARLLEKKTVSLGGTKLSRMQSLNLLAILFIYQALVFFTIAAASTVLFFVLGRMLVPKRVAAEWIFGSDYTPANVREIDGLADPMNEGNPWTRVALLLALFSLLYLIVTVVSNSEQQRIFISGADDAIRFRLVRLAAYRELISSPSTVDLRESISARDVGTARHREQGRRGDVLAVDDSGGGSSARPGVPAPRPR